MAFAAADVSPASVVLYAESRRRAENAWLAALEHGRPDAWSEIIGLE